MKSVLVYKSPQVRVVEGANVGDELTFARELFLDDTYMLEPLARCERLLVRFETDGLFVGKKGEVGQSGQRLYVDCCVTFMSERGQTAEALVLVEVNDDQFAVAVYLMPLSKLDAKTRYTLIGVDSEKAPEKFAHTACVFFAKGTRITLSTGMPKPIEELNAGDEILTRDAGVQEIRWIGQVTMRASGAFAPVAMKAGALSNVNDLVLGPEHRLFIYQRSDELGTGRSETLVRVRHLVNGNDVIRIEAGYIEYYQILFDEHQFIYAKGLPVESQLLDQHSLLALPKEAQTGLKDHDTIYSTLEVSEDILQTPNALELLRKATGR